MTAATRELCLMSLLQTENIVTNKQRMLRKDFLDFSRLNESNIKQNFNTDNTHNICINIQHHRYRTHISSMIIIVLNLNHTFLAFYCTLLLIYWYSALFLLSPCAPLCKDTKSYLYLKHKSLSRA